MTNTSRSNLRLYRSAIVSMAILLCLLLSYWILLYYGNQQRKSLVQSLQTEMQAALALRKERIEFELSDAIDDVLFLSQTPPVSGIERAHANNGFDARENTPIETWHKRFTSIATSYLNIHPSVYEVRYIGIANNGRELIKVTKQKNLIQRVADNDLFQKAERPYFIATTQLNRGEAYLSDINLYEENGKIIAPNRITLRATTPIYSDDEKLFGMIVSNVDLGESFRVLQTNLPAGFQLYLIDAQGNYLIHPDAKKTFGMDLGKPYRWQNDSENFKHADSFRLATHSSQKVYQAQTTIGLSKNSHARDYQLIIAYPERLIDSAIINSQIKNAIYLFCGELALGLFILLWASNRRRDAELLAAQSKIISIIENSGEAIIGQDLQGLVTSWNSAATKMFGYSATEVMGKLVRDLIVPPELHAEDLDIISRAGDNQVITPFRSTRITDSGQKIRVLISVSAIRDNRKNIIGIAKTLRDISQQENSEQQIINNNLLLEAQVALRTQELETAAADYAQLVESAPFAMILVDTTGKIQKCNVEALSVFGYTRTELLNTSVENLLPDNFRGNHAQLRESYLENPHPRRMGQNRDLFARHQSGKLFPVEVGLSTVNINNTINVIVAITDISHRKKLEKERKTLSQILEMAPDFICTSDMEGNLGVHNRACLEMVGIPIGTDISHMHIRDMHPEWAGKLVLEVGLPQVMQTGVWVGENALLHRDGHEIPVTQALMLHRNEKGEPEFLSTVMRDISDQKNRERELFQARLAADAANRAKSEFIANMSHEIRTPMNAVLGMMQLMMRTPLNTSQQDYLQKAQGAAQTLLGILNDILDYSKVEAGKLEMEQHPFALDKVLRNLSVIASSNIKEKPIEVLFNIPAFLPNQIIGDSLRLEQVLINLTSNAVKFTEKGQVLVSVKVIKQDDTSIAIKFSVQDSGIGISPEQWNNLFKGFSQAEASTTRRFGGSGLGLVISKRLVELMGGELTGHSNEGQGACFEFTLPFNIFEPHSIKQTLQQMQKKHVLIVDDNPLALEALAQMIKEFGWRTKMADSGESALHMLQKAQEQNDPFDVMFIDWVMPGLDGIETCRKLNQQMPQLRPAAVIMLSAYTIDFLEQKIHLENAKIDNFLTKPVTPSMLYDSVAQVLIDKNNLSNTKPALISSTKSLAGLNLLLTEDNLLNQQVAYELLTQEGAIVSIANNGEEAVNFIREGALRVDIILMDIQMPVMDGFTATQEIRKLKNGKDLPIIAMTANAMLEDREAALQVGMTDHIGKPFNSETLIETVKKWNSSKPNFVSSEEKSSATTPNTAHASDENFGFDVQGAVNRLGGKPEFYLKFLKGFTSELDGAYEKFNQALLEQNYKQLHNILHSIKGLAGTMGAVELQQLAKALDAEFKLNSARTFTEAEVQQFLKSLTITRSQTMKLIAHMESPTNTLNLPSQNKEYQETELIRLNQLLLASDLHALEHFAKIETRYRISFAEEISQLETFITKLDFARAAEICEALLKK